MTIDEWRDKIDEVDERLLELLNERARAAQAIAALKNKHELPGFSPGRERQIRQRLIDRNSGPLLPDAIKAIYREILSSCRGLENVPRVVFLGPPFSYTSIACQEHFGSTIDALDVPTIPDVFAEVEKRVVDYGIVPIENTAEGGVNDTLDMFTKSEVKICGEAYLEIHHCLLAQNTLDDIAVIYSREIALAQCKNWLKENMPNAMLRSVSSTSEGARLASQEPNAAAVAHRLAADHYGLSIVAEHVEDIHHNKTRFLIIGNHEVAPSGVDKTTILFSLSHKPGSLYRALGALDNAGINMTMITSRPARHTAWEYLFLVDFQGHCATEDVQEVLSGMREHMHFLKILGSYPEAD